MRPHLLHPLSSALLLTALLSGCSSGWMPPDVDRGELLSSLGEAGYGYVCSEFEGYLREQYTGSQLTQVACLAYGVKHSDDARACGERVDACIHTLPPEAEALIEDILEEVSCKHLELEPSGCRATVAELEACLDGLDVLLSQLKYAGACATVGAAIDENWWRLSLPEACRDLRDRCTG